ncbi:peptidylprolyl isomerase [Sphingomonas piscis]|uniref:Peptidylprolyl isomerase n=1 Tax=Sphingomonas piscis TaxID=2714943 RepID=A0A6G7YQ57_9SPHN|nr:peptidylprolyl isomerase [Sphingomonas piscis]QIK78873.1 peptidylprolyl isomerase [Sphingomonas piscis]
MRNLVIAGVMLAAATGMSARAQPPKPLTPGDIVAAAPASAWKDISPDDLLVMQMGTRRIVIQLAPAFAPVHVANIRTLARGNWWEGASVYRVQDNYVAQWGQNETEKPFPAGIVARPPHEYWRALSGIALTPLGSPDAYAPAAGFWQGWPVATSPAEGWATLPHCYGYVGVARDLAPDTGTGAELYAIIGHAPRTLDRNIAVVGRVIEGIDALSSLSRGTGTMGFYKEGAEAAVPLTSVRVASQLPAGERPRFQYLDTASATFTRYLKLRANRNDDFFKVAAGGVDLCGASVPVRKTP